MSNIKQVNQVFLTVALLIIFQLSCVSLKNNKQSEKKIEKIIDGVGIGNIVVGQSTSDQVIENYGNSYRLDEHDQYSIEMVYQEKGLSFYYEYNDSLKTIFSIVIKAPVRGITKKGIVLGKHTMQEVIEKYGPGNWRTTDSSDTWWIEHFGIEFHVKMDSILPRYPLNKKVHLKKTIVRIDVKL